MQVVVRHRLHKDTKESIRFLWNDNYPKRLRHDSESSFEKYFESLNSKKHFLLVDNKNIVGWLMIFKREGLTNFAIIIDHSKHGQGLGKMLLKMVMAQEPELYGWVIDNNQETKTDGSLYHSPLQFYVKMGFEILHDQRVENERISAVRIHWKES